MNRLCAPVVDRLLNQFDNRIINPSAQPVEILDVMDLIFKEASCLAPVKENSEVKRLWLFIPRGEISDYCSYEEMLEWEEVASYPEYELRFRQDYPDEINWYELILVESEGYRGLIVNNTIIVSAQTEKKPVGSDYRTQAAVDLCTLLAKAVHTSIALLRKGTYNSFVERSLPYKFRSGIIKRSVLWKAFPEMKEAIFEGMDDVTFSKFQKYLKGPGNDAVKVGRIRDFTGIMFLKACAAGYRACGYEGSDLPLVDQYLLHADGRDEGLTGKGHGLSEGPGIDLDSPLSWDEWYYDTGRFGGHPWEVCRGGNSTHVDLFVRNDKQYVSWQLKTGRMTAEEASSYPEGYYFEVAGNAWNRSVEAVKFFVSIKEAGYPVILRDADAILARFKGTDLIGIVPHNVIPNYCENMFPPQYGRILDFMHIYEDEMDEIGNKIEWLAQEEADLKN